MNTPEHLTRTQLLRYAADELPENERRQAGTHLLQCAACRRVLPKPAPEQLWTVLMFEDEPRNQSKPEVARATAVALDFGLVFALRQLLLKPATVAPLAVALALVSTIIIFSWRTAQELPVAIETAANESKAATNLQPEGLVTRQPDGEQPASVDVAVENGGNKIEEQSPKAARRAAPKSVSAIEAGQDVAVEQREIARLMNETPPAVLSLRSSGKTILRSNEANSKPAKTFALSYPIGVTVTEAQPRFRWAAIPGARNYRVSIMNSNYDRIVSATVDKPEFAPDKPLPRGATYLWRVTAEIPGGEAIAPAPPQPPALFRVAGDDAVRRAAILEKQKSERLALAAFYAEEGMLTEAAIVLRQLLRDAPRHRAARRLLRRVEIWQAANQRAFQSDSPITTKADQ